MTSVPDLLAILAQPTAHDHSSILISISGITEFSTVLEWLDNLRASGYRMPAKIIS